MDKSQVVANSREVTALSICMDSQVLHVLQIGEFVCDIHTNN